jgi:glucans biosynthesis protein
MFDVDWGHPMPPNSFRPAAFALWVVATCGSIHAQTWLREDVDFQKIEARAQELAQQPYQAPDREALPRWMKDLTYDQYRDIRFKEDQALWQGNSPFRAMFLHPGYRYRESIQLREFTSTHSQDIRYTPSFFNYGPSIGEKGEYPPDAGFSGVKLLTQLNRQNAFDELVVFQGSSRWRALGKHQRYGVLSSRGVAINTGVDGAGEEFPAFREFWLRKPSEGDQAAQIMALLDGPSVTGAYAFVIHPGEETVMVVKAVLFPRTETQSFGIAPLSSMFWFGENSRRRFDDFRPEVHDSDGLMIRQASGECLWRPLTNDTGCLEKNYFDVDKLGGFGLLQRDRRLAAYEDPDAMYHQRSSLWIEPMNEWGSGKVFLMELPATNEISDNVVAMWQPDQKAQPGQRLEFVYRQRWTMDEDPAKSGGHVVATRTGLHDWRPEQRTMIVEFAGLSPEALKDAEGKELLPQAAVELRGDGNDRAKIQGTTVQRLPGDVWRMIFQIAPAKEGGKLAEIGSLEIRACLKQGENFLTETWTNRVTP